MRAVRTRTAAAAFLLLLAAPLSAQRPTLTPADYAPWETITLTALSPDGRWFGHVVTREQGDDELRIRDIERDTTHVIPYATRPTFAPGARWLAWSVGVSEAQRDSMPATQPVRAALGLLDLRTRTFSRIPDVADFSFSSNGRHLALRGFPAGSGGGRGVDVIVRDLETGADMSFGNIAELEWQPDGPLLALVIDGAHPQAHGVRVYDPRDGSLQTLHADTTGYTGLAWHGDDLAVLQRMGAGHVLHAWRDVSGAAKHASFSGAGAAAFPDDHAIVSTRPLRWSEDGATVFFGIRAEAAESEPAAEGERPTVQVWHSDDIEIVPEVRVRAGIESMRSHLAAWRPHDDAFVQLGNDVTEDVTLSQGRYALGTDATPYDRERMFGPAYRDLYVIDVRTGERTRIAQRVQHHYGLSETGRYALYVKDGHFRTYDTRSGRTTNITQSLATSFINTAFDFTIPDKPPFGTGGWTVGDRSVLLYDRYDVWEVRPDGSGGRNMTNGAAEHVRHRRMWLTPEDRVVDLSRPVFVSLYGERTKKAGYARLHPDRPAERLIFDDRHFSRLGRAAEADVFHFSAERFDDSPDFFVAGPRLSEPEQVTHTNPFQHEYAWGRAELIDYRSTTGHELQGALFYPANYESGRQYPLIVFPYEITSNTLHHYVVPSERTGLNTTVFTQNGYFVLRPDVVFRARDPGVSSLESLLPALDRVLATGMIDSARMAIVGHSWGGYQAAFAVTQTDRFAAGVAGAPLANMISMYLSIYWNSGGTDARMFEIDQGRMEVPFWDDLDAYIRNSPVFHVREMQTPLLVSFGDRDGAVDWNQGVELYNAARRAGKELVMLVYEGENHSLARRANQVDYHRRVLEWLAHYLKGEPAREWMTRLNGRERDRER